MSVTFVVFGICAAFVCLIMYWIGIRVRLEYYDEGYRQGYKDASLKFEDNKIKASVNLSPHSSISQEEYEKIQELLTKRLTRYARENPEVMIQLKAKELKPQAYIIVPGTETYEWDVVDRYKLLITSMPIKIDSSTPIDGECILAFEDLDF